MAAISYIDTPPQIKPHAGGFLVTLSSGDEETTFMLTLHALTSLSGAGMANVKRAQEAQFEAAPYQKRHGGKVA